MSDASITANFLLIHKIFGNTQSFISYKIYKISQWYSLIRTLCFPLFSANSPPDFCYVQAACAYQNLCVRTPCYWCVCVSVRMRMRVRARVYMCAECCLYLREDHMRSTHQRLLAIWKINSSESPIASRTIISVLHYLLLYRSTRGIFVRSFWDVDKRRAKRFSTIYWEEVNRQTYCLCCDVGHSARLRWP